MTQKNKTDQFSSPIRKLNVAILAFHCHIRHSLPFFLMTSSEPGSNDSMSFGQGAVETFGQFGQGGSLEVLFFDNPHELLDLDSCE